MSFGDIGIRPGEPTRQSTHYPTKIIPPFSDPVKPVSRPYSIPTMSMPPPITSGWKAINKPVKPVEFIPKKGFTDRYMELSAKDPAHKELAKKHIRYAEFMKRHESDHKPYKEISDAFVLKNKNGHFVFQTPGRDSVVDNKTQTIGKAIHYKLLEIGLQPNENGYYSCPKTGTVMRLVIDPTNKEVCACFYGLRMGDDETRAKIKGRNVFAAMREFFGGVPEAATQAAAIGAAIKEAANEEGFSAVMVGHSHGGGLAQAAALPNGLKGVVFNSRPMGAGVRRLYREKLPTNAENIIAFTGKGDWLGGNRVINSLSRFLERIGISAPRTIGHGYNLPEAPGRDQTSGAKRMNYQHNKFLKQLRQIAGDDQVDL